MNVMNTFVGAAARPSREVAQKQAEWSATQSPKAQASQVKPRMSEAKVKQFFVVKFEDGATVRFPFA